MATRHRWECADKLLCLRLDSLGDVVMTTPAIRALKASGSSRHLTLLTSPAGAQVTSLVPEIDEVIVYEAPWMKASAPRSESQPDFALLEHLRRTGFDGAVIFTVYSQSPLPGALLCYLAGIPLRLAHCRENPYQLLTDWVPEPEPEQLVRHEVRRQLDLVRAIGCETPDERLRLQVPGEARRRMAQTLRELGLDLARPWAVVHPGASAPSRRYPAELFAQVARGLVLDLGCQVLFTGVEAERPLVEHIQAAMAAPSSALVGQTSVVDLTAVLSLAPVLVANNTGPVHLAAGVGTPVVDLYALTNPQHTPWQVPSRVLWHDVPCKYCYKSVCPEGHHQCLRLIPPEAVVQATAELLLESTLEPATIEATA